MEMASLVSGIHTGWHCFSFSQNTTQVHGTTTCGNRYWRHRLIVEKLSKVLDQRYIGPGVIWSLTAFFDVPKGADDIRMVYDGTVNGFNDCIEVPKFGSPTVKSHLRAMSLAYYMVDANVGECFLNFYLHARLQAYVGVDLTRFIPLKGSKHNWAK